MKTYKQVSEDRTSCDHCGKDITDLVTDRHPKDERYLAGTQGMGIRMTVLYESEEYVSRKPHKGHRAPLKHYSRQSDICPKCLGELAQWYASTMNGEAEVADLELA